MRWFAQPELGTVLTPNGGSNVLGQRRAAGRRGRGRWRRCRWRVGPGRRGRGRSAWWCVGRRARRLLARRGGDPGIEGGGDERVPQRVRADRFPDAGPFGETRRHPAGAVPVQAPPSARRRIAPSSRSPVARSRLRAVRGASGKVQDVGVAGQPAVAGQEPGQRLPLTNGEKRISDQHQHAAHRLGSRGHPGHHPQDRGRARTPGLCAPAVNSDQP